jgi:multidrug efflux system membrane fusion protein
MAPRVSRRIRPARHVTAGLRLLAPLVLAALLGACAEPAAEPAPRPAIVTRASAGTAAIAAFAGEVRAREESPLGFRIAGKIARRLVDVGATVRAGQPLAELDAADVSLQSEANRAQLASAQSDLALARAELQRHQELAAKNLVSRSLLETRDAAFRAAEARVRQARAQAAASGNQVGYAVLRAPADGVIAQRLAEAGQVVAAGQTVFVLAADGGREVAISVPEQSVAQFAVGRELVVELWAAPGKHYPARLRELSPSADPATRTYAARVAFEAPDARVELGQSARVYAAGSADGLSLPLSALTRAGDRPAAWVVGADGVVHRRALRIGPYGEERVPVLGGLRGDEWVVSAGVHLLREGERVLPIDRDNRPVRIGAPSAAGAASPAASPSAAAAR